MATRSEASYLKRFLIALGATFSVVAAVRLSLERLPTQLDSSDLPVLALMLAVGLALSIPGAALSAALLKTLPVLMVVVSQLLAVVAIYVVV